MTSGAPIGIRIAKRRQVLGITQGDLARELSRLTGRPVSKSSVANWERGKHYPQRYLGALEEVLGVSLDGNDLDAPDAGEVELRESLTAIARGGLMTAEDVEAVVASYRRRRNLPPQTRAG